jgi:hypothetical protein
MAFTPPNFNEAEIMRAGMTLVPDYAAEQQRRLLTDLQRQDIGLRQQQEGRLLTEAARKHERQATFQEDVAALGLNPDPGRINGLMAKYPEFSEGLKRAWDSATEEKRGRDMGQLGEVRAYLRSGNIDRAKAVLRARVDADKKAGLEPDEQPLLEMLEGGDPNAVAQVQAQVDMALSVGAGPDKFASAYGALVPGGTEFEKQHEFIRQKYGEAAADTFAQNKYDPVVPVTNQYGTSFYRSSGLTAPNGEQQPSTAPAKGDAAPKGKPVSDAGGIARSLFPDVQVTQVRRDPNSSLGKKNPKSWHNRSGAAVDVAPIEGMTFQQYVQRYRDAGYTILEARDEVANPSKHATGPHWHVVLGGGPKGPQRVSTRQQYAKLPSGTEYIAPDGTRRVKP